MQSTDLGCGSGFNVPRKPDLSVGRRFPRSAKNVQKFVQRGKIRNQNCARRSCGRSLQPGACQTRIERLWRRGQKVRGDREAVSIFAVAEEGDIDDDLQPISKWQL